MKEKKYINDDVSCQEYILKRDDVLMARTGATYGKSMIFDGGSNAVYASFLIRIRFNDLTLITPKYYWHFAQSSLYWKQANKLVGGGAQPQFNANVLGKIIVPVPPIKEQLRIVSILDRFEALTTDLQSGLPAEIAARRQQYEYYREKLLTFKRKAA